MAIEIERKFLVVGDAWREANAVFYSQGYLSSDKARTVRVRIAGEQAFLTIKGVTQGMSRAEFEYEIPLADAHELLQLCEQPLIEKYRRKITSAGFVWEVDEFLGENQGLVVAEIELPSEDTLFTKPEWVGAEVTADVRYFNSNLVRLPFKQW
ncbi:CYTH domain-containing protein [Cellvibrio sp. QJXJ]|uniref:CYTH domain-containing protein n=1 Tax=Cellvibrio sp. QJXJ TaxID=2964606 RepID=UPI0021C3F7BF|nr:CYTH domain-containing protein [Cellvibrio sp. QJXJ]UUA70953.1 CYTH domain-containing protein [Cellvibrio sp. QJXJ]